MAGDRRLKELRRLSRLTSIMSPFSTQPIEIKSPAWRQSASILANQILRYFSFSQFPRVLSTQFVSLYQFGSFVLLTQCRPVCLSAGNGTIGLIVSGAAGGASGNSSS